MTPRIIKRMPSLEPAMCSVCRDSGGESTLPFPSRRLKSSSEGRFDMRQYAVEKLAVSYS